MNLKSINKFITSRLVRRIREDADSYRILNERDLESLVYHELRKKLNKYEDVKISTNFTVTGTSWKRKSGGAGKFIQPDIVILESRDKSHIPKMHVAIELKARTPGKAAAQGAGAYRTLFRSRTLQKDFKKLNKLKEDNLIDTGYFLYLFHDTTNKEHNVKKILEEEFPNITDRKRGVGRRFEIIMINKFENPKTGKLFDKYAAEKFRHRSRQLYRYYADPNAPTVKKLWKECKICHEMLPHSRESDQIKHGKKKKKKSGRKLKISKRKLSERAKKAARTRKRNAAKKKRQRNAARKKRKK
jgi:hypothetical protein